MFRPLLAYVIDCRQLLREIRQQNKEIKMQIEEVITLINAERAQVRKVVTEIQALKDQVATLQNAGTDVPQELADAITGLGADIQTADDLDADATVAPDSPG